jgi:hypothetical protein
MSTRIADKAYDGDGFRAEIANRGAKPVIPNKSNRVTLHSFSGSRISGASQLAMTNLPETSWLPSTSPPSSPIGYLSLDPRCAHKSNEPVRAYVLWSA